VLDALLCRLVFTCYLFDREVIGSAYLKDIGLKIASHLRDVLGAETAKEAKTWLYRLFAKLGEDFNGDLFNDDLDAEARQITQKHIQTLREFFDGTLVRSGQRSFWPYDFSAIPIETISAIYEHFLKSNDQKAGAFYTPRFLAEIVLDNALGGVSELVGKRFLDPACGSGIFLVGLFNRLAEEWKHANPNARNDRRARELMAILRDSLFGVDINPTACRITAFSLYLAYLDQLAPRDIQDLQDSGRALPHLVAGANHVEDGSDTGGRNIICADFFGKQTILPTNVDVIVGNPPWGSIATENTPAGIWCDEHSAPLPDNQIANAFVWKAADHISQRGTINFILPHGTLFNHSRTAVAFQKAWIRKHEIERVLNLADFRWFLFEKAVHPAIVVSYKRHPPETQAHRIQYWAPKADWLATQAEIISVSPSDRSEVAISDLLHDLDGLDAPQTWKQRFWATARDLRFIDRLSLYPRLRDHVRASRDKDSIKPWVMAEGFQPVGTNDDAEQAHILKLPSRHFIDATNDALDLFLLPDDCRMLKSNSVTVRSRSNKNTLVFKAPHVLITKGFNRIAFANFDVSFRHALRGIHGPQDQSDLLAFLAAYLRTSLARYFMFHTSASWGMYRPEGHVEEVLRLPMPFPEQLRDGKRARAIVGQVAGNPTDKTRANHIIERVMELDPEMTASELANVLQSFQGRHRNLLETFEARSQEIKSAFAPRATLTAIQRQLIGAYFVHEYSFEASAVSNPSIVSHPDQAGAPEGGRRFILSLRAVGGEGHISSLTFRSGYISADGSVSVDPTARLVTNPSVKSRISGPDGDDIEVIFKPDSDISERVIFPVTASQSSGIEDARFVEFADGGRKTFYATYIARSDIATRSELLETTDFVSFRMSPLRGPAARSIGMALFPRKIGGKYAMIGKQDNENLCLIYSADLHFWASGVAFLKPQFPWEFVQVGNCGSPIELDEGWLLLTYGVGAVGQYSIGATLLDKNDPSKVLSRSRQPLIRIEMSEREGYVPNLVSTCGAMRHNDQIVLPYAAADTFSNFATIKIAALMRSFEP
jgi:predicted GH43/DUF377 family glycosyl hydrolase